MRVLRKSLSVILLLVIVPLLIAQIALQSIRTLLLDPAFPKQVMRESGLYAMVERSLVDRVVAEVRPEELGLPLTRQEIARVIQRVMPAHQMEQVGDQVMDGLYAWAWGSDPYPTLMVDLSDLRRSLDAAVRAELEARIEALPVCTREQAMQVALRSEAGMPPCKAPEKEQNRVFVDHVMQNLDLDRLLPRQIDLAAEIGAEGGPGFWEKVWDDLQLVRFVLNLIIWGWVLVTLLLLLLALLNLDSWHTPFGWVGAAGVLAGAPLALTGLGGAALLVPLAERAVGSSDLATTVVMTGAQRWSETLGNVSLTVLLLGVAAVALAVYGRMNVPPSSEAPPLP